jgi:hypothetical protein
MFSADGKLLVALSVMLAMLCVPPRSPRQSARSLHGAQRHAGDVRRQTGLGRSLRGNQRERRNGDGKNAESNHSASTCQKVTETGAQSASRCAGAHNTGLIRSAPPRAVAERSMPPTTLFDTARERDSASDAHESAPVTTGNSPCDHRRANWLSRSPTPRHERSTFDRKLKRGNAFKFLSRRVDTAIFVECEGSV